MFTNLFMMKDAKRPSTREIRTRWDNVAKSLAQHHTSFRDRVARLVLEPALIKLLRDVSGTKLLDAACGDGWLSRRLAHQGARVTGIDFSERMIELARRHSSDHDSCFMVDDLTSLRSIRSEEFDVIVCHMALMSIPRFDKAFSELARVLRPGGRFLWSVLHPCFLSLNDFRGLGWTKKQSHWYPRNIKTTFRVDRYFDQAGQLVSVLPDRPVWHFHRPLNSYYAALHSTGLVTTQIVEPTTRRVGQGPIGRSIRRVSYYLLSEAMKPLKKKESSS